MVLQQYLQVACQIWNALFRVDPRPDLVLGKGGGGGKGKAPSIPKPPPPPTPPSITDQAAQDAAAQEAQLLASRRGRASTILTSPEGVLGDAPVSKKSLLGA